MSRAYSVLAGFLALYAVAIAVRSGSQYLPWLDEPLPLVVELTASVLCLSSGIIRRASRTAPVLLGVGLALWSFGDLTWALQSSGGAVPVPSVSDGFFLSSYPFLFAAVLVVVRQEAPSAVLGSWLDGLLSGLAAVAVAVAAGVADVMGQPVGTPAQAFVNLAYPIGDLVLLAIVVGALVVLPRGRDLRGLALGLGGLSFIVADFLYLVSAARGEYRQGSWIDLGWPVGVLVMSASIWLIRPKDARQPTRVAADLAPVVPMIAFMIGAGILVKASLISGNPLTSLLATATLILALVRVWLHLRQLRDLRLERELRSAAETAHALLVEREAAIRALATRLTGLFEAAPVGIIELGPHGRVLRWNAVAERIYGWTAAEAVDRPWVELSGGRAMVGGPDGAAQGPPAAAPSELGGTDAGPRLTQHHWRRDGTGIEVEVVEAELLDDRGVSTGQIMVVTDVTRRIELEVMVRHSQKLESLGQLAAGIAHEINTPIQFVGDNIRFLQQVVTDLSRLTTAQTQALGPGPEDGAEDRAGDRTAVAQLRADLDTEFLLEEAPLAATQALAGIERVRSIVGAMKALGHPGDGQKASVDLAETITNVLLVANNELAFVADVRTRFGDLPPVWCHPGDLQQVLLNLVINAAHAVGSCQGMRGRGTITVTTSSDCGEIVITISDTGCGIDPDIAAKIFDPFFTTKPVGQGTGQGLTLARSLVVDRHGGTLTFTSEPGAGTTFIVRLPQQDAPGVDLG